MFAGFLMKANRPILQRVVRLERKVIFVLSLKSGCLYFNFSLQRKKILLLIANYPETVKMQSVMMKRQVCPGLK